MSERWLGVFRKCIYGIKVVNRLNFFIKTACRTIYDQQNDIFFYQSNKKTIDNDSKYDRFRRYYTTVFQICHITELLRIYSIHSDKIITYFLYITKKLEMAHRIVNRASTFISNLQRHTVFF